MTTKQHSMARIAQWSFRTWIFHLFKRMRLEEDDWELLDDEELLRLGLRYSSSEYVWAYSKGWRLMDVPVAVLRTQGNRERKTNKTSKRRKRRKGRKRREESWKWKKRKAQTGAAGSRGVWIWHRFRGSSTHSAMSRSNHTCKQQRKLPSLGFCDFCTFPWPEAKEKDREEVKVDKVKPKSRDRQA